MASMITFLSFLVLVARCYCAPAPKTYGFGGTLGSVGELELKFGGKANITRDGLAFTADTDGIIGADGHKTFYGNGYGQFGDHFYGANTHLITGLGLDLRPGGKFTAGLDSKGNVPLEFNPHLKINSDKRFRFNAQFHTDDDAKRIAALNGAVFSTNPDRMT